MNPAVLDELAQTMPTEIRESLIQMATSPAGVAEYLEKQVDVLKSDPLLLRYLQNRGTGPRYAPRLTEPWMALGEQRSYALLAAANHMKVLGGSPRSTQQLDRMMVYVALRMAQTFLWTTEVFNTIRACPMPSHTISSDLLPFPFTYHSTEVAYDVQASGGSPSDIAECSGRYDMDATLIAHIPPDRGLAITQLMSSPNAPQGAVVAVASSLTYGTRFPEDIPEGARPAAQVILSMLAFLRSPYAVMDLRQLPRQMRRHGGCAPEDVDKLVNVVTLRRETKETIAAYEAASVEWKHRWWVSGHFRAQWYPSTQSHEVIWIPPYLKGPEGAPMLNKVYRVSR